MCQNGDSSEKGTESKSLVVCTFQYDERPTMSMGKNESRKGISSSI